ncbi:hypothetical protein CONCODRAFT_141474 [Conidiobolus coronatus NRRL 28638]|uniref:RING-type domain-containing protein n=1 Tax=Conidiobolus coronatus (strain ATCC 28846 / CBS 209.66 / NRRL 28638) TaxID=796925 RepID=A0A137NRX2_CONC2|nr:hypothetical protein CONCODRAFT_141474 [Conidiobolus coronatus NRRL 28638]|eukprot:KXN65501.1 hypothetical protein CONCODRAFT_141474 [Conidiobolus coronatus NRRL 28638]
MKSPAESSDECEVLCPLCLEDLDLDEQEFFPCSCDYQICKFCYQKLEKVIYQDVQLVVPIIATTI